jgi:endogenous inhibitor of DNA gyrase (YacG/DUF329 family)
MAEAKEKTLRCPICKAVVPLDSPDVPFCSDRCRLIDLGKWASGEYRISSPILDPETMEEVEAAELRRHKQEHPDDER